MFGGCVCSKFCSHDWEYLVNYFATSIKIWYASGAFSKKKKLKEFPRISARSRAWCAGGRPVLAGCGLRELFPGSVVAGTWGCCFGFAGLWRGSFFSFAFLSVRFGRLPLFFEKVMGGWPAMPRISPGRGAGTGLQFMFFWTGHFSRYSKPLLVKALVGLLDADVRFISSCRR